MPDEEGPTIRKVYDLYGAGDRFAVKQFNYAHNYNVESREAMYAWFGRWLRNDPDAAHFRETPFEADTNAMRVWTADRPMPADALSEPGLVASMVEASEKQLAAAWPKDAAGLRRFREAYGSALAVSLGVEGTSEPERPSEAPRAAVLVGTPAERDEVGRLAGLLRQRGVRVATVALDPLPPVDLWNAYYTTYNRPPVGDRVAEVVEAVVAVRAAGPGRIDLVGLGPAGLWVLLARGVCPVGGRSVVDASGFASGDDQAYVEHLYAPGLRRAGDVRAAAVLGAPAPLCVFNMGDRFESSQIAAAYRVLRAPLRLEKGSLTAGEMADWLASR